MNVVVSSSSAASEKNLIRQARAVVHDLFEIKPHVYWLDFILSAMIAYTCAALFVSGSWNEPISWLFYAIGAAMLYRISMFVHEAIHFRQGQMTCFQTVWNLTAGLPLLMPTFAYENHLSHHNMKEYGTGNDGEYLPLVAGGWIGVLLFLAQIFFQPILVFLRFLFGTPISFLHPKLRRWMHEHATSLVINFRYQKIIREEKFTWHQTALEVACFLRAAAIIAVVVLGFDSPDRILKIYLLAVGALSMNHIRTLAAHRYQSNGHQMSHAEQFLDSTNITGSWLTEIVCPVGLRYHALHHLFPSLPYHNLGIAHRRLVRELPKNSIYFLNIYPSIRAVLVDFAKNVWEARRRVDSRDCKSADCV